MGAPKKPKLTNRKLRTRLRQLRSLSGLSASELSDICGLNRTHLGLIEAGTRSDPKGSTLQKIANVFGVSVGYLLNGDGDAPTEASVSAAIEAARAEHDRPARTGT